MIDDLYQSALSTLEHHLDEAGMPYTVAVGAGCTGVVLMLAGSCITTSFLIG